MTPSLYCVRTRERRSLSSRAMTSSPSSPSTSPTADWRGHAALTAVQVFFGLFPVFAIWTTGEKAWSPYAIAVYRIGFGALVLAAIALIVHRRRAFPGARDLFVLAVGSVLGVTLNQVLFLQGVAQSTSVNAGLVMCLIPVFTFTIAALVRQETFALRRALGVLLALSGTAFWFVFEKEADVAAHGKGNLLMIANALSYSIYLVLSKPLLKRLPPLVVIAWIYVLA
ncbi:MAG: DMT family transporter, partial [Planctomycetota bacterium]